jgi:hypothetical protein
MRARQQPREAEPAVTIEQQSVLAEYFTPAELAQKLKISTKQVIRFFEGRPGVLNLGGERRPTRTDKRGRYFILRISHPALVQFLAERQA